MPITAPTIAIVDNEDGTATVTVTGSDAAHTNTLYTQNVNLEQSANTWTTQGSRVGDGTIIVSLANGFYYFYVEETDGVNVQVGSTPQRSRVSDGVADIYTRCLDAVQATVQELSLTGVPDARVYLRTVPQDAAELETPSVFVFPFGAEAFSPAAGTSSRDELIYPVMVAFIKSGNQEAANSTARGAYLDARQKISDTFRNQRLPGVSESLEVATSYRDVIDKNAWLDHNLFAGGIVLNIKIWQVRGMV
jgi:hypothetical protein